MDLRASVGEISLLMLTARSTRVSLMEIYEELLRLRKDKMSVDCASPVKAVTGPRLSRCWNWELLKMFAQMGQERPRVWA